MEEGKSSKLLPVGLWLLRDTREGREQERRKKSQWVLEARGSAGCIAEPGEAH